MQTNQSPEAVSNIPGIVHQYMHQEMTEAVREAVQTQTNQLQDSIQRENDEFLKTIDDNMKKIIKEQMEGDKSIQRSDEQRNLYKALVEAYDADKTILDTYGESAILKRRREEDDDQEGPFAGSDQGIRDEEKEGSMHQPALYLNQLPGVKAGLLQGLNLGNCLSMSLLWQRNLCRLPVRWRNPHIQCLKQDKTLLAAQGNTQSWINALAKQTDARSSFNELLDTPIDFSNFIMNRLGVDTLTPELLAGPTYELIRGSCNSLTELEYHLEEVYKPMTDQLDWDNPEGQKRQQFYGFAVNRESALDAYSKRRIIDVTDLKIVEWHNYKYLDWISVRRDNDKIYKFKEGDFKRLRLQGIEDMLLLLVQGKLSNLTVEERFAFNVSLRMFTRSIVIQWHVEDLQLGVKSYQKRPNLTKPDTYRSDLKRREAYTAYSNPRGFIYQNRDKKNRLMRINELHKFSDGMLNDVRNALDDHLKGIRMQYLPTTI
uniref:Uncharacterized protein n=1 Tax=Tanacetum cinerariifolium TaxID=118510 RepID=A0A699KC64_TANCI|nr:hypothetical protein [Tanacetum cinerariifolium]